VGTIDISKAMPKMTANITNCHLYIFLLMLMIRSFRIEYQAKGKGVSGAYLYETLLMKNPALPNAID
jgi:hypothetical protein